MHSEPVAGYRLVRKLGSGSRAQVFLGHAGLDSPRTAAVKVFRAATSAESIDAEVYALSVANHAHVVQLRDLSTGDDLRPVLVLERLELGSLGQLLAARASLTAGEAVTILAPLAAAVEAIHESGVAHGGISPARVLFRESGAPVLSGFGRATRGSEGVDVDNRALALLATTVLERVPEGAGLREWLEALVGHPRGFGDRLGERLFGLAAASPVRFEREPAVAETVPSRTTSGEPVPAPALEPVETTLSKLRDRVEPYLARIPSSLRKPRYAAGAAALVTVVIAIAVVPAGDAAESATVAPSVAPVEAGPVVDDDPIAAFTTLVDVRNRCIRDLSVLCLDAVLQQGSAAMDSDIALIRSIENGDGGSAMLQAGEPLLVERMGDAALISYTVGGDSEPASVLLVKGEAGWRIRSYVPS